jgi:hypothetical protein
MSYPKFWIKVKAWTKSVGAMSLFTFAVLFFLQRDPEHDLSIVFAGYTNSATGVPIGNFVISNAAPRVLFVSKNCTLQKKQTYEWRDLASTNMGVIALLPKQTFVVRVSKPTNCEAWRISMNSGRPRTSLLWRRIGNAYQRQRFRFEPLSYLLLAPVLSKTLTYSEEITN